MASSKSHSAGSFAEILKLHPISDFSLIAVGGYGRKDLSPKSDVDLLFIYKTSNKNLRDFITSLNNSLWDLGLEVGISFLTIKQAIIDSKKDIKTITKFSETRFLVGDEVQYGEFIRSIKILSPSKIFKTRKLCINCGSIRYLYIRILEFDKPYCFAYISAP